MGLSFDIGGKKPRVGDTIIYQNKNSKRGGSKYIVLGYPLDKQENGTWVEKLHYKSLDTGMEFTRAFHLCGHFELVEQ